MELLNEIGASIEPISQDWGYISSFFDAARLPSGDRFDLNAPLPNSIGSFNSYRDRVNIILGKLQSLNFLPKSWIEFPLSQIVALRDSVFSVRDFGHTVYTSLRDGVQNFGNAKGIDPHSLEIIFERGSIPIRDQLLTYFGRIEDLLTILNQMDRRNPLENFNDIYVKFGDLRGRIETTHSAAEDQYKRIEQYGQAGQRHVAALQEAVTNLSEAKAKIDSILSQAEATTKNAQTTLSNIDQIQSMASQLQSQVSNYTAKFNEFDGQLAERSNLIISTNNEASILIGELKKIKIDASSIVDAAKVALNLGTAHGLADSFAEEARRLTEELFTAKITFYVAILALAIWTCVVFFVPEMIGIHMPGSQEPKDTTVWATVSYILVTLGSRILLLAPGFFFLGFAIGQFRQAQNDRAQFVYKRTIAAALPGFSKAAEPGTSDEYVRAMTTAAFERLLFNPQETATKNLASEGRGGWLSNWLVKIVARAFAEYGKDRK